MHVADVCSHLLSRVCHDLSSQSSQSQWAVEHGGSGDNDDAAADSDGDGGDGGGGGDLYGVVYDGNEGD